MGLSAPWDDSLDIIALQPVQNWLEMNPMGRSVPWDDFLYVIAFHTAKLN